MKSTPKTWTARTPARWSGRQWLSLVLVLICLFSPTGRSAAQEGQPSGPVYVVQEGDSLWDIALRFNLTLAELQGANSLVDPNQLQSGMQLTIPGLEGVQGILTTEKIGYGETLTSLSRRYNVPVEVLVRLNHLAGPGELFAGANLIIPQSETEALPTRRVMLAPGQSLLELAVLNNTTPWALMAANRFSGTAEALPGDVLHLPGTAESTASSDEAGPGALPGEIQAVEVSPLPMVQGAASVVRIQGATGLTLGGELNGRPLHFFEDGPGDYVSLQGLHAMVEPGLYPLVLTGTLPAGETFAFSQPVFVRSGNYPFDPVLTVNPETIDPAVTRPEDAEWSALAAPFTPEKQWAGIFGSPAPEIYKDCWPSTFGNRRSYNGSAYSYFHTGLDFCGGVGTEIYAPAAGTVVFAGPLTVRGNATMIDHGWGVYTGYMHQTDILVQPGDRVEPGQVIGTVGGTGRVTGPHLHWEVWVGGVQVEPLDWLEQAFP